METKGIYNYMNKHQFNEILLKDTFCKILVYEKCQLFYPHKNKNKNKKLSFAAIHAGLESLYRPPFSTRFSLIFAPLQECLCLSSPRARKYTSKKKSGQPNVPFIQYDKELAISVSIMRVAKSNLNVNSKMMKEQVFFQKKGKNVGTGNASYLMNGNGQIKWSHNGN